MPLPRSLQALAGSFGPPVGDGDNCRAADTQGVNHTVPGGPKVQHAMAQLIEAFSGQSSLVRDLAFAPDGGMLASASHDGSLKLWELSSGRCLHTLTRQAEKGRAAFVHRVAWSPNGETLASSGSYRTIWLWDAQRGTCRAILHGHSADVRGLAFTPDSSQLLSSSEDGTLRLWDVEQAQCIHVRQGHPAFFYDLAWSP